MVEVTTAQGKVLGRKCLTVNNVEYYEFIQIPYAEPPVGELRFKAPRPPQSWEGVRDTTIYESKRISFQLDLMNKTIRGSEDCLYLNVYTPKLANDGKEPLGVLVFFHGGAFAYGSGTYKNILGPDYFIEENVIVVTFNFRVGIFGFLSLDIPEASGNMGLKDQTMVLRWIQQNISAFGGDKNNVAIFGISSGASSVEYHILSQHSKGLFNKAIINSASTLNHWSINYKIKDLSVKIAQAMGYQGSASDIESVYNFYMSQPLDVFSDIVFVETKKYVKGFSFGFVPCIEKDFENGEAFITKTPYKILKEDSFNVVPVLRGFTNREGLIMIPFDSFKELLKKKNFTEFWEHPLYPEDFLSYNSRLLELYTNVCSKDDPEDLGISFFTDFDFVAGILTASKFMIKRGVPIYFFKFGFDGKCNIFKNIYEMKQKGACHADEFNYLFHFNTENAVQGGEDEIKVGKTMTKMYANFVKTSNPTPEQSDLIPLQWPKYDMEEQKVMVIDKDLKIESLKEDSERIKIYEEIYEKYSNVNE